MASYQNQQQASIGRIYSFLHDLHLFLLAHHHPVVPTFNYATPETFSPFGSGFRCHQQTRRRRGPTARSLAWKQQNKARCCNSLEDDRSSVEIFIGHKDACGNLFTSSSSPPAPVDRSRSRPYSFVFHNSPPTDLCGANIPQKSKNTTTSPSRLSSGINKPNEPVRAFGFGVTAGLAEVSQSACLDPDDINYLSSDSDEFVQRPMTEEEKKRLDELMAAANHLGFYYDDDEVELEC